MTPSCYTKARGRPGRVGFEVVWPAEDVPKLLALVGRERPDVAVTRLTCLAGRRGWLEVDVAAAATHRRRGLAGPPPREQLSTVSG